MIKTNPVRVRTGFYQEKTLRKLTLQSVLI